MATYNVILPAGPIWNDADAQTKGPIVAAAHLGKFTGEWNTEIQGAMSVVQVALNSPQTGSNTYTTNVLAGPIWSDEDAKTKCPVVCASYGGTWNGEWHTIVEGVMSVCSCTWKF